MSDTGQPSRQLDDVTRNELARALGNAAPDDTAASDDTGADFGDEMAPDMGGHDSWADFTPIPEHIDPSVDVVPNDEMIDDGGWSDVESSLDEPMESVRIVQARPAAPLAPPQPAGSFPAPDAREHEARPKIIRIDDFAGSHEVTNSSVSPFPTNDPTATSSAGQSAEGSTVTAAPVGTAPSGAPRIVTIGDDELPDAVFVKGSLDSSSPSVVVIDDAGDEAHGPLNSPAGTRRSIEPRLRDRRVAVKREAGRRRLRLALIAAIVVVVLVGVATAVASPLFAVNRENVTVTGAVYTDQAQLEAVIDELVGTPALRVDTKALEAQLNAIPWVDAAHVKVRFPHSATIDIRERRAMATYQGPDGRFRVIDINGRVLAVLDGYPIAYMLVYMPDAPALEAGQQAPIGLVAAAELTKVLTPELRPLTVSVTTVSDGSSLELNLKDGTRVVFGPATDLIAKVIRLQTRLQQAADGSAPAAEGAAPKVIDVSTAETGG